MRACGMLLAAATAAAIAGGCQAPGGRTAAPTGPAPQFTATKLADTIAAHNRRVAGVQQMYANAVIEIEWVEDGGRKRFEQGEGPLILRKPRDLALAVRKLGETFVHLGSDADRFWLFELKPPGDQPSVVHVGRYDELDPLRTDDLPAPVRPDHLLELLGITPLPAEGQVRGRTTPDGRFALLHPAGPDAGAAQWRIELDPGTTLPAAVRLIDAGGDTLIESKLSSYEPLKLEGSPPGAWPDVPTRIAITAPSRRATVTLFLSDPSDGRARRQIRDAVFDLNVLLDRYQPQRVHMIGSRPAR